MASASHALASSYPCLRLDVERGGRRGKEGTVDDPQHEVEQKKLGLRADARHGLRVGNMAGAFLSRGRPIIAHGGLQACMRCAWGGGGRGEVACVGAHKAHRHLPPFQAEKTALEAFSLSRVGAKEKVAVKRPVGGAAGTRGGHTAC